LEIAKLEVGALGEGSVSRRMVQARIERCCGRVHRTAKRSEAQQRDELDLRMGGWGRRQQGPQIFAG